MGHVITVKEKGKDIYEHCKELEKGMVLFFPQIPFTFPKEELNYLFTHSQKLSKEGTSVSSSAALEVHSILGNYSLRVTEFLRTLLEPYAQKWEVESTILRPQAEKERDLLHIDSFEAKPTNGKRILRFFTNIHPKKWEKWIISSSFKELIEPFEKNGNLFPIGKNESFTDRLKKSLKKVGWNLSLPSPYDSFIRGLQKQMKENRAFQNNAKKDLWEFPPQSCWMFFTDQRSHASVSGESPLEQTIFIPRNAMLRPEEAPVSILERVAQQGMVL